MSSQDPSSDSADQFAIDAAAFIIESIPDTGIKLLRAKPESEPALSQELQIPYRLELLRRSANPSSPQPGPHRAAPHPLKDVPAPGLSGADAQFLQDVAVVGQTSHGETVYLVLSVVADPSRWNGGWFLGVVPPHETEAWQAYLAGAREQFVLEIRHA